MSSEEKSVLQSSKKLGNIQVLRAFAALIVIMYHIVSNASISQGISIHFFYSVGHWGFSGVDLFFVISGFVMIESQRNRPTNSFEFFKARVIRIVPLYWLLTFCYWTIATIFPTYFQHITATPSWLFTSLLFTSGVMGFGKPIIGQGWTLEFEMLFYLFFASTLWLRNSFRSGILTIALITIAVLSFTLDQIVFEFCFGLLAGVIHQKYRISKTIGLVLTSIGGGALLLELLFGRGEGNRVLLFGLPSMFLVLGVVNIDQLKNRFLLALGDASYSSYLLQFFVIPLLFRFTLDLSEIRSRGDILVLVFTAITVLAGQVLYVVVEKRLTSRIKRFSLGR